MKAEVIAKASKKPIPFCRELRREQTLHEAKLWKYLRNRQLNGLKFRRQHPIVRYIVDFCCMEKRLVVELDGGQHNLDENRRRDKYRDEYLSSLGFTILRIWNSEINKNFKGVLEKILELCK